MSKNRFIHAAPVLPVDDINETIRFYRETLGFAVDFVYGDPPYYAIARRGEMVTVHFSEREDTSKPITPCNVYIFVEDVDALYSEYSERGIEMFSGPETQEWGMREFELPDLNGHFLTFGQEA